MNSHQRIEYMKSLSGKLKGVHVDEYYYENNALFYVKKYKNSTEYLIFDVKIDGVITIIADVYELYGTSSFRRPEITINEPVFDNLERIIQLYFEQGKGKNPNNPTLGELINYTGCRTKSARKF